MKRPIPDSDLRRAFYHLLKTDERRVAKVVMETFGTQQATRAEGVVPMQKKHLVRSSLRIIDRPLSYPFTKGIASLNDGVAYGDLLSERWVRGIGRIETRTLRRTRTGRTEAAGPNGPIGSEPPPIPDPRAKPDPGKKGGDK